MIWCLMPILLGFTFIGYLWGPPATPNLAIPYVLRNRLIAAIVIVVIGAGVHVWINTRTQSRLKTLAQSGADRAGD